MRRSLLLFRKIQPSAILSAGVQFRCLRIYPHRRTDGLPAEVPPLLRGKSPADGSVVTRARSCPPPAIAAKRDHFPGDNSSLSLYIKWRFSSESDKRFPPSRFKTETDSIPKKNPKILSKTIRESISRNRPTRNIGRIFFAESLFRYFLGRTSRRSKLQFHNCTREHTYVEQLCTGFGSIGSAAHQQACTFGSVQGNVVRSWDGPLFRPDRSDPRSNRYRPLLRSTRAVHFRRKQRYSSCYYYSKRRSVCIVPI